MLSERPFNGSFLQVIATGANRGNTLENPRLQEMGGREFIVGQQYCNPKSQDARAGLTVWIPVEEVVMLIEYPDIDRISLVSRQMSRRRRKPWWPFG
jgi:hypothetical protein